MKTFTFKDIFRLNTSTTKITEDSTSPSIRLQFHYVGLFIRGQSHHPLLAVSKFILNNGHLGILMPRDYRCHITVENGEK